MEPIEKLKTGILGLDEMLHGGLLPGRPYIVSGPTGSGKSTLCMQFLLEGAKNGEKVLYVTLEEPPNELKANMEAFGWDLAGIKILDAISDIRRMEPTPIVDITSRTAVVEMTEVPDIIRKTPDFESLVITVHSLQQTLRNETERHRYDRIAVDSITALKYFCMEGIDESSATQSIMRFLSELRVTTLLIVETPELTPLNPEIFLARGEIRLHKWWEKGILKRGVSIEIYRGSRHDEALRQLSITNEGIDVELPEKKVKAKKKEKEQALETVSLDMVDKLLASVNNTITKCGDAHLDVRDIEAKIANAATLKNSGSLGAAYALLRTVEMDVDTKISIYNVTNIITSIEGVMSDCKEVGIDLDDVQGFINQARRHLKDKMYEKALEYVKQGEKLIDEKIALYNQAMERLSKQATQPQQSQSRPSTSQTQQFPSQHPAQQQSQQQSQHPARHHPSQQETQTQTQHPARQSGYPPHKVYHSSPSQGELGQPEQGQPEQMPHEQRPPEQKLPEQKLPEQRSQEQAQRRCSACGRVLTYLPQYARWYCSYCRRFGQ